MNKPFFENLKPWSERKHRLLGKYLPPFSAKVARTTLVREIFIIDGFAGAAVYDDGSQGSPILIASFGDVCLGWAQPINLRLINVEADKDKELIFESLEDATKHWVQQGRVQNIRSEFGPAVPQILNIVGHAPALFFIDPFGPTDIRFDSLKPILSRRTAVTELIINFDQDGLRRIVDAALSANTDPKTAETNAANISAILGSDSWRGRIEGANLTSAQAEEVLLNEYIRNLANFGFSVVAYPIREDLKSKPKYYFVYCTRHPDGLELMNDFIREEEDRLYNDDINDNFPLLSDEASLANAISDRRRRLGLLIEKHVRTNSPTTRKEVRINLILSEFGEFHSKDYNAAVAELIGSGQLVVSSGKKRINDTDILRIK